MNLQKIRSIKHPGAIFLRHRNKRDSFVCKVYPANNANYIADTIIRACKQIEDNATADLCGRLAKEDPDSI